MKQHQIPFAVAIVALAALHTRPVGDASKVIGRTGYHRQCRECDLVPPTR